MNYLETIKVDGHILDEYERLLNTVNVDFEKEDIPEDSVIRVFSVTFKNGYEADIKLCAGTENLYVDPVLFSEKGAEIAVLDTTETFKNDFNFEFKNDKFNVKIVSEYPVIPASLQKENYLKIVGQTEGKILYQEQIIKIGTDVLGLSFKEADKLMRDLSKKESTSEWEQVFLSKIKDTVFANSIFDEVKSNVSKTVSYNHVLVIRGIRENMLAGIASLTDGEIEDEYQVRTLLSLLNISSDTTELLLNQTSKDKLFVRKSLINELYDIEFADVLMSNIFGKTFSDISYKDNGRYFKGYNSFLKY